jgi:hypothetical protein
MKWLPGMLPGLRGVHRSTGDQNAWEICRVRQDGKPGVKLGAVITRVAQTEGSIQANIIAR